MIEQSVREYFIWADPLNAGFTLTVISKVELGVIFKQNKQRLKKADGSQFDFEGLIVMLLVL